MENQTIIFRGVIQNARGLDKIILNGALNAQAGIDQAQEGIKAASVDGCKYGEVLAFWKNALIEWQAAKAEWDKTRAEFERECIAQNITI